MVNARLSFETREAFTDRACLSWMSNGALWAVKRPDRFEAQGLVATGDWSLPRVMAMKGNDSPCEQKVHRAGGRRLLNRCHDFPLRPSLIPSQRPRTSLV